MGGWGFALIVISGVLFWGLVAIGIVLLVRCIGRAGQSTPKLVTSIAAHHGR
jgi:putative membrane protein